LLTGSLPPTALHLEEADGYGTVKMCNCDHRRRQPCAQLLEQCGAPLGTYPFALSAMNEIDRTYEAYLSSTVLKFVSQDDKLSVTNLLANVSATCQHSHANIHASKAVGTVFDRSTHLQQCSCTRVFRPQATRQTPVGRFVFGCRDFVTRM